jgi:hypothetical protein
MTAPVSLEGVKTYYGLIPDGNATVVLTLLDGSRTEVAVIDNVLTARPAGRVRTVEFRDAAGISAVRPAGIGSSG